MRRPTILALAFLAAGSAGLSAQTGPGFFLKPTQSWIIINSFNSVPGDDIRQVFHAKLGNDRPGTWTTCLTVGKLPRFWGGDRRSIGVAMGVWDPFNGTFTVNTEAKALNSSADDRHLTVDPAGLWAILDRPDGVWLGSRQKIGTAFGKPVKVSGFGSLRAVYPALAPVGGKMKVFYTNGKEILMQGIDLQGAKLTGSPVVVSRPLQAGAKPIAPTPVIGADGDAEGLFLCDEVKPQSGLNTGDSDMVWASDLDPATPPSMVVQRPDYTNCGSPAGGYVSFAHNINPRWHVMHSEAAWLAGDVEGTGGTADLRVAAVNRTSPATLTSTVFVALKPVPRLAVPGINGWFALDASLVSLGTLQHKNKEGIADMSFPIPNDPFLKGWKLALQAIVLDRVKNAATFTSTAWLEIN